MQQQAKIKLWINLKAKFRIITKTVFKVNVEGKEREVKKEIGDF